jgi:hypothetical protein
MHDAIIMVARRLSSTVIDYPHGRWTVLWREAGGV